jgi:hypothetical protein
MDEDKPSIPPRDLRSASERPAVAIYYRDEEEVRRGFLIALRAMGFAQVEESPEPATRPVRGATP